MKMQLALELDDAERDAFSHWVESAAVAVDPDRLRLTPGRAVRALIRTALGSETVTAAVIGQLQGAEKDRPEAEPVQETAPSVK